MEDSQIVALYWERSERAIAVTAEKYGALCQSIAGNLLGSREDAEECVNDTYLKAWNSMPEARPLKLGFWLGRVVRNIAIDLYRKNHARKRYSGLEGMLLELDDCIPSPQDVESTVEAAELGRLMDTWLQSLPGQDRDLFILRYWYSEPLNRLSERYEIDAGKLAKRMYRIRLELKAFLEKEGISL